MLAGGNWNNGVIAGARAANLNNQPWNVNTNIGCRLACDGSADNRRTAITVAYAVTDCQIVAPGPNGPNYVGTKPVGEVLFEVAA